MKVQLPVGNHSGHYENYYQKLQPLPGQMIDKVIQHGYVHVELRAETNVDQFVLVPHTGILRAMPNAFSAYPTILSYKTFEHMEEDIDHLLLINQWDNTTKFRIAFGMPVLSIADNNHTELKLIVNKIINSRHKNLLQISFVQGWDMYNNSSNYAEAYVDTLSEMDADDCYFYLCNIEIIRQFQQAIPMCHAQYYSIYPTRISAVGVTETHPKFFNQDSRYINRRRTRKTMCLNNANKPHREAIVDTLNIYDPMNQYTSMRSNDQYLKPETILGVQPGGVHGHNFLAHYQDCPPLKYMTDTYTYIATETYESKENLRGLTHQIALELGQEASQHDMPIDDFSGWWTEKTFKALYYELPFMVVGVPGTLSGLKSLGFKTFPEFFDESYDSIDSTEERSKVYNYNIENIMTKTHVALHDLYYSESVQNKLKHNKELFLHLIDADPFN